MANNHVTWEGLEELRRQLLDLPADLAAEAREIVIAAREEAFAAITYPVRTTNLRPGPHRESPWYPPGNLAAGLRRREIRTPYGTVAILTDTSPHATLYEYGTQIRQTRSGANRGRMPKAHVFIPAVLRSRRRMYDRLIQMVIRAGFLVTGGANG